jgi:BirA family biotin operon repressor/biotin-[acetyl-CoA-carboxylase] ligase
VKTGALAADLSADGIEELVRGDLWKKVCVYQRLDSTNERARMIAAEEERPAGTIIIADMQERGRGRLGRQWVSPPARNVYMSMIMDPRCLDPHDAPFLTIITSLASVFAVKDACGLRLSIKWPNDLMAAGKKIGGILTEVRSSRKGIVSAVVGIGINVNILAADFPDEIRPLATSIMIEAGCAVSRSSIVVGILRQVERWHAMLCQGKRVAIIEQWRSLSSTIGTHIQVITGGETLSGYAEDIDENGLLMLRLSDRSLKKISSGDLTRLH